MGTEGEGRQVAGHIEQGPLRVHRGLRRETTRVAIGGVEVGGPEIVVIGGPCAVESESQVEQTARAVAEAGAQLLRGGAFKPRTSPYAFQGHGLEGLELLAAAGRRHGLPVVTEVMSEAQIESMAPLADCLQVGARNMQNFDLLRALGRTRTPVLLKRGMGNTADEWLLAAEYVLDGGNPHVVLCERGIRTFERATRFTLDLAVVAWAKQRTHLPVIVDPSHGTGVRELVEPMALAAIAAGADGVMVEVHPRPEEALSDGPQALTPPRFAELMQRIGAVAQAVGRTVRTPPGQLVARVGGVR